MHFIDGWSVSKKPKALPTFRNEADERRFWETHDSSALFD
jgi:hypothetical protein